MHRLAAIDIGTVTTRLLVADVAGIAIEPLCEQTVITHLGEGVAETNHLTTGALERVGSAIGDFKAEMTAIEQGREGAGARPIERVVAMATSAARDADNARELEDLLARYGVELMVIEGEREAHLSFLGASSAFARDGLLLADIGGGSTELVFGDAHLDAAGTSIDTHIIKAHSFDLGCRRLTDLYLRSDPPTTDELAQAHACVRGQVEGYLETLPSAPTLLLTVGGTATTLAAIHMEMVVYDARRVHGSSMDAAALAAVAGRLASCPLEERKGIVGLQPARAGVIVAGAVILQEVLDLSGLASFTVGESDILEGMLLDAARGM